MSKLISKNARVTCSGGDLIMTISDEANRQKAMGKSIINGSIGMFFDEAGKLASFPIVDECLKNNITEQSKKYDSITGNNEFKKAIKNWLFNGVDFKNIYFDVIGTMGATGALALINKCYVNDGEAIILPSIRWGNYDSIAYENNNKIMTYNLFDDKHFDISSFKSTIDESCNLYNKAVVIINDPCENPTGYSLSDNEWDEILFYLSQKSKDYPIVLVDDIAYLNFKNDNYRNILQKFVDTCNDNLFITLCFSSSKTLQIYGLRGGALISLTTSKEINEEFNNASRTYCRSTWSSPNHLATNVIADVFNDEKKREELVKGLDEFKQILKERGDIFINEAKDVGLYHYPYEGGFFILVPCAKNDAVAERLREKGIFVVPMCGGLRISIASIAKKDVVMLAKKIKEAIEFFA